MSIRAILGRRVSSRRLWARVVLMGRICQSAPATTQASPAAAKPPAPGLEKAAEPAAALAPMVEPAATPAPAVEPAAAPAPAVEPKAESEKPTEWSQADDDALVKMKADKETWAEIEEAVKGRSRDDLKARYRDLMVKKGAEAEKSEASSPESKIDVKKGKGKGREGRKVKETQESNGGPPNNGRPPLIHFNEKDGLSVEDVRDDISDLDR